MAAHKKKRATAKDMVDLEVTDEMEDGEEENDDNEDDQEEMEGQEFINKEVMVEFEARNLEDSDFHGVRKLLSQVFLKANIDLSEMTDTLVSQNYIGSAIKQVEFDEDEDDLEGMDVDDEEGQVFGLISVLNITERKNIICIKQLKSMLLDRCSKCAHKDKLASVLNDDNNQVGFILNERFINIPPQIAAPSFESLWKEVERAKKKHMKYDFNHFLLVTKTCKMSVSGPQGDVNITTYINPEEEIFSQAADFVCEYSVKEEHDMIVGGQWDEDEEEMEPFRQVIVISADKIADVMVKLKEAYG